jgi:hypothetical protein
MRYQAPSRSTVAATALMALVAALTLAASKPVEMRVDGQPVLSDVPPVTSKNAVYVPLRPVSDALGAETHYERKTGDVVVTRGDQTLKLKVGSTAAKLNGMPMTLRSAPFRVRGRVMVSLHAVQQAFGVRVRFNRMTARVDVNTPGVSDAGSQFETQ